MGTLKYNIDKTRSTLPGDPPFFQRVGYLGLSQTQAHIIPLYQMCALRLVPDTQITHLGGTEALKKPPIIITDENRRNHPT